MKMYILNTNALAQSKEGALKLYPEREKNPAYFYISGETKKETVYATVLEEKHNLTFQLFGMETKPQLRGFNLTVKVGPPETKKIFVGTNFDAPLNARLMQVLWSGGPYSFLNALVALEEEVLKDAKSKMWLREYLLNGGIGALAEKRMNWPKFFEAFKVMIIFK